MLTKKSPKPKEETEKTTPPTKRQQTSSFEETPPKSTAAQANAAKSKTTQRSKILIKYNVGFLNHLTIRGQGADLSWHKGQPLKNISIDEWVWETDLPFTLLEFKILINDQHYELGNNNTLKKGEFLQHTPLF